MAQRIRKGDRVVVLGGKNRNQQGTVLSVDQSRRRVTVEGVSVVKRHQRPSQKLGSGGIVQRESAIDISNVMLLHKGERTKVGFRVVDGVKKRWSRRHDEVIDG